MAVTLYREGDTHTIRGHQCEAQRFEIRQMETALKSGWFTSPNDFGKAVFDEVKHPVSFEDADTNKSGKLSNDEVREAAKKAGIEGWDKRRISKLKVELGYA